VIVVNFGKSICIFCVFSLVYEMAGGQGAGFNADYVKTLQGQDLIRYKTLLTLCNDVDPYELVWKDCKVSEDLIPSINLVHIINYLFNITRTVSMERMANYASTEAYRFLVDGWVQDVRFHKVTDDRNVCLAKVRHSYAVNLAPLRPWALVRSNGDILGGWCDCKAGCGETCNHLGALLYALEYGATKKNNRTCTSLPCSWLPPSIKEISCCEVRKINLRTAERKRRRLLSEDDEDIDNPDNVAPNARSSRPQIVPDNDLQLFFERLKIANSESVIFRVLPEYCHEYAPVDIGVPILDNLFNKDLCHLNLSQLRIEVLKVLPLIKITLAEAIKIEKITRQQRKVRVWRKVHIGRIGASDIHALLSTSVNNPSITTVMNICNPTKENFKSIWMMEGIKNEAKARSEYVAIMGKDHPNFIARNSGFVIPLEYPYLGASPDGRVSCDCCGKGLVEIKCTKYPNDKPDHIPPAHYDQIQQQLLCVGPNFTYCDYFVYHVNGSTVKRVYVDQARQQNIVDEGGKRYKMILLPELVGRYFSSLKNHLKDSSPSPYPDVLPSSACYCMQAWEHPMVKCVGSKCTFVWFHLRCQSLARMPRRSWLCPECKPSTALRP